VSVVTNPDLASVETPVGVVDLARVRKNAQRVADYCSRHGLAWRPHIKTHKSTRIARIQLEAGATGVTVATPREAEVMSTVTDDILLAYPPLGDSKLSRLMSLPDGVRLSVALDSAEALSGLSAAAAAAGRTVEVLIEIDVGLRRVGVETPADVARLADQCRALPGVRYRGLMFYPGHIRMPRDQQAEALRALTRRVEETLQALSRAGATPEVVSAGSTPTLWDSHLVAGVTEVRAGSCIFNDREALTVGAAGRTDLAYTVLATVVSTAVPGQAAVDAGSKALSKEVRGDDGTFAVLRDHPDVRVSALSEEHGVLDLSGTSWRPAVGERVHIVPNHVCVSVNLQDHVLAVDGESCETLELEARGRGPYPVPTAVA
jgi:D-serine deaminase-like pyridoxal phosphate-dependent protein